MPEPTAGTVIVCSDDVKPGAIIPLIRYECLSGKRAIEMLDIILSRRPPRGPPPSPPPPRRRCVRSCSEVFLMDY